MESTQRARLMETIVAQSTAPGTGAIAIVRLSGSEAFAVAAQLGCDPARQLPYKLVRVLLAPSDGRGTQPLDDALVAFMPGPNSYTGENLVELHLHGGIAVVEAVLSACMARGARSAEPGEFTLRAFVNGRLNLAQAEAVGALIHAHTENGRARALAALKGGLSEQVLACLTDLEGVAAAWLAQLDFPDDTLDGPGHTPREGQLCAATRGTLEHLLGRMVQEHEAVPEVALLGAVNAGKSTLTNALCGFERAIVDAEAGTTRDIVEVPLRLGQQRWQLLDTAGHRSAARGVEARGIALGLGRAQQAALVLWLCDGRAPQWPPATLLAPVWILGARADELNASGRDALRAEAVARGLSFWGFVSGHTGEGVAPLRAAIAQALQQARAGAAAADHSAHEQLLGNARQRQQLQDAIAALEAVAASLRVAMPLDLLLADLQQAIRALGEIVGRDVDARVVDRVFSDFCIGK